ncbi:unnamed protein product [Dicrocoelium dendriticum]|nr:unnamed protein product [Dicrocoelium dendriticum]CAI2737164.1 unnamed protein product [Dicrocoelium dendriticum]
MNTTHMNVQTMVAAKQHDLLAAAAEAQLNAFCPVSQLQVGAAVLTNNGEIFSGSNVEIASLPCGWCAEISAVAAAVSHGFRKFIACAVSTSSKETVSPCGRCRQVLAEFAGPEAIIFMRSSESVVHTMELGALLPLTFKMNTLPQLSHMP